MIKQVLARSLEISLDPPHEPCPICNGPVERRQGEERNKYMARKACSPRCRNLLLSVVGRGARHDREPDVAERMKHPPCSCGNDVPRYEGEHISKWLSRKTCSPECAKKARHAASLRGAKTNKDAAALKRRWLVPKRDGIGSPTNPVFERHNLTMKSGSQYRLPRLETHVPTRVAGRW